MADVSVNSDDLEALHGALDASSLPGKDMLASIVTEIQEAVSGEGGTVIVNVEVVVPLRDTFDAAFEPELTPDPAPVHGAHQVSLRVMKITR
jgi:hypothetical protein